MNLEFVYRALNPAAIAPPLSPEIQEASDLAKLRPLARRQRAVLLMLIAQGRVTAAQVRLWTGCGTGFEAC